MKKFLLALSVLFFINPVFPETGTDYGDINYFIKNVAASSNVSPSGEFTFVPENLLDGVTNTCWKTQFSSSNRAWIEFSFKEPVKLCRINIANGSQRWIYQSEYYDESRIKKATVIFNDDYKNPLVINFRDREGFSGFAARHKNLKTLKIIIDEIYEGKNSKDLAVSDIVFWGETPEAGIVEEGECDDCVLEAVLNKGKLTIESTETRKVYFEQDIGYDNEENRNYNTQQLDQDYFNERLIVSAGRDGVDVVVFGIFNCRSKKWIFRFDNNENTQLFSSSPDGRYVAIDTGTSACGRGLNVFDIKTGCHVLATGYKPMTTYFPEWEGDRLVYYRTAGKKVEGMPEIPAKEYKVYVRKIYFEKGIFVMTDEYREIVSYND